MTPTHHMRRLHRSFAAVEARYLRDLDRRDRGGSRAARLATGPGYRNATERGEIEHRRIRAEPSA
jgi:hypothetical protein